MKRPTLIAPALTMGLCGKLEGTELTVPPGREGRLTKLEYGLFTNDSTLLRLTARGFTVEMCRSPKICKSEFGVQEGPVVGILVNWKNDP